MHGAMRRDPRHHRRYKAAAAAYIAAHTPGTPCVLCGRGVDTTLPGTARLGPTIEHRVPVRVMQASGLPDDAILEWACDIRLWAIAHRACQSKQGGHATRRSRPSARPSRW